MNCPDDEALFAHLDEPEANDLAPHVTGCSKCRERLDELGELVSQLREPVRSFAVDEFVRELRDVTERREARVVTSLRRRVVVVASVCLAAAMAVIAPKLLTSDDGSFASRSGKHAEGPQRDVELELHVVSRGQAIATIESTGTMRSDDHLLVSYATRGANRSYQLLCFAIDAKGDVRWLYPAYVDPSRDPVAMALPMGRSVTPMDTEVVFDDLPPGSMSVFAIVSRAPMRVSDVERMAPGEIDTAKLSAVFTDADVRRWTLDVSARGGSL